HLRNSRAKTSNNNPRRRLNDRFDSSAECSLTADSAELSSGSKKDQDPRARLPLVAKCVRVFISFSPIFMSGLNPDSLPSAFCQDDVPLRMRPRGGRGGEITMSQNLNEDDLIETLNEDDFVETDAFVPSSDIVLAVAISQKLTPSQSVLEERDRQYDLP